MPSYALCTRPLFTTKGHDLSSHGVAPDRHEDAEDEDAGDDEQPEVEVNFDHRWVTM
jgi:hypothetical protein